MAKWKKFVIPLSSIDLLDVKLRVEKDKVTGFSLNYRTKIKDSFFESYRVDTAHGFLHEQRYWLTPEPIPIPTMGKDLNDIFNFYLEQIKENFERYKKILCEPNEDEVKKMVYKMTEEKWDAVKSYLNKVWKNPDKYPDKGLILSLSDEEITQVFTKKRLELVRLIQSKKPKNATTLSKLTKRRLSAVMRDLGLLEKFHIVELQKKGKNVVPLTKKEILILPLVKLKAKRIAEIKATA